MDENEIKERIKKELKDCQKSKRLLTNFCSVGLVSKFNPKEWKVVFKGPRHTVYDGGIFHLNIKFEDNYPSCPPTIVMVNKTFHPNINFSENANICVTSLSSWMPERTMTDVIISIINLLSDPNPGSPLNRNAAELFENDKAKYKEEVKKYLIYK